MVVSQNRGRPRLTRNEQFFFETLYQTLLELRDVAEHLNLKSVREATEELLRELEERFGGIAAAESSEQGEETE